MEFILQIQRFSGSPEQKCGCSSACAELEDLIVAIGWARQQVEWWRENDICRFEADLTVNFSGKEVLLWQARSIQNGYERSFEEVIYDLRLAELFDRKSGVWQPRLERESSPSLPQGWIQ